MMRDMTQDVIAILERLVSFETISARSNLDIVNYIQDYLKAQNIDAHLSYDDTGERANIHAVIGPSVDGGVVLNGHTDVVPVEGQVWTTDPFVLRQDNERLYGRGAVDMKGFLACMLASVPVWQQKDLKRPIHISMCYDEEIGGFGAPVLVEDMGKTVPHPGVAIVGEPTGMGIITGHKGAFEMLTKFTGFETHSCDPRKGVNAIFYAAGFISHLHDIARKLEKNPDGQSPFDPAYATFNVGTISGGTAGNITAGHCEFIWEFRPMPGSDGEQIIRDIDDFARSKLLPEMRHRSPHADVETQMLANVPGLDHKNAGPAVDLVSDITGLNSTDVVSFGTDAGHFNNANISTIVFGPGSIDQAHKPDEYIEISEVAKCMGFLDKLGDHLAR